MRFRLKLYERYVGSEAFNATWLVLGAFLALFGFFDLVAELKDVGTGGYELGHAMGYVVLRLPGRLYELMPIAVLIGTLFALSSLARHSEISVLRVSGLSTAQLLGALFKVAAVFALITLFIGELVTPVAERAAQELRVRISQSVVAQEFRSGLWVKDLKTFVNVRSVSVDAQLENIRIYEFDDENRLQSVSQAVSGEYLPPDAWRLRNVETTVLGDTVRVEKRPERIWRSALNPDILSVLLVVPERMSLPKLLSYIRHLSDNRQKTQRYEIAVWKKMVYPLASLVMVALALPFGYTHNRVSGVSLKIFSGVMIGIVFHMLNGLFSSLGVINSWPPLFSALAPSALFLVAAVAMLSWVERR
jgi:lipopolysaccharide export system permease protein